ncbi:hypothetical protein SAMN05216228_100242 [Rhizobium tibeticum]|uniref:Uncharacterized protein n=1 Tax=Rhizobium tibeticum TaxID=501024 RepID=A0A1H8DHX6_9HYPH|nr:hypothetical protein [Rhizobium tibeticum]SEH51661.1 hypothetical protein RTCCBAU85039_0863 [Rhizobium tibeticum]SEN06137.1 hypothetical protein SAMN05216228_100242 [Rhizobium tibeticum]
MAEILTFPPKFRVVSDRFSPSIEEEIEIQMAEARRRHVAQAFEHVASANIDLVVANLCRKSGFEGLTDDTMIGLVHAMIDVIDALGCRNADLPLRRTLNEAIERMERAYAG